MQKKLNPLTIGFVLDDSLDKSDGVQQYVLLLGKWLSSHGHNVHYITTSTGRTDIANVHSLGSVVRVGFNQNKLGTPLPVRKSKINALFRKINFDVLHVQTPHSPLFAQRIITMAPKTTAIVATFHILPYGLLERYGTKLLGQALQASLKRINTMLAVSKPAARLSAWAYNYKNVLVVPNTVELLRFKPKPKKNMKTKQPRKLQIVFLGRLVPRKGCRQLLGAINLLINHDHINNFHLHIYSDGPERQNLEKYVKDHNMTQFVAFHGYFDESQKPDILQKADVAVYPSLGGESFGIVLLEAMAAGASTVLAGNNPGYASVMESLPEQLVDPTNKRAFADKIKYYLQNREVREQTKNKQQELVKKFDVNHVGKEIEQVYLQAIAKQTKTLHNT